jgi:hypothetical protein
VVSTKAEDEGEAGGGDHGKNVKARDKDATDGDGEDATEASDPGDDT